MKICPGVATMCLSQVGPRFNKQNLSVLGLLAGKAVCPRDAFACRTVSLVLEPDPRKIEKEGLVNGAGWK